MAEGECMNHPSGSPATEVSGEERGNAGLLATLESYLELAKKCMEAVQNPSPEFNNEQCDYLADKLEVVVLRANSFLMVLRAEHHGPCSSADMARWVSIFKLLLALAKEIESFIQGCCENMWIQAAMSLTNVSEYVSWVGFNLELCQVTFCKECSAPGRLTLDQVDEINKVEVETVERKASDDMVTLLAKLTSALNSLSSENRDLATYLLQRLLKIQQKPASTNDDGSYLEKILHLFKWLKPIERLGRGASATVEKVMWLGTPVAKKTFLGPEDPNFMQEVQILARLCHPNITAMYGCEMMKRSCSIIMELMDGNLYDFMQIRLNGNSDSTPFSILEAVGIMLQVGDCVNYLHNKQIVHRDLKSANILVRSVTATGYVHIKVADFGLSKTKRSSTFNQSFNTGTCRWMAPEIINLVAGCQESPSRSEKKKKHPFKCDVYSFGMVCYEILTGDVPFQDEMLPNLIKKMVMRGVRPNIPDECPQKLKALIQKCWDQTPSKRPSFDVICKELRYLKCLLMTGLSEGPHLTIEEPLQAATKDMPLQASIATEEDMPLQASTNVKPSLTMMQAKDNFHGRPLIANINGRQKDEKSVSYPTCEDEWALFRHCHDLEMMEMKEMYTSLQEIRLELKRMGSHRENASNISSRHQSLAEKNRLHQPRRRAKYAPENRANWNTGFAKANMHVQVPYGSSWYYPTAALFEETVQVERVNLRKFVAALTKYDEDRFPTDDSEFEQNSSSLRDVVERLHPHASFEKDWHFKYAIEAWLSRMAFKEFGKSEESGGGAPARRIASWEEYRSLSLFSPVDAINPEEEIYCRNFHLVCRQKLDTIQNELKWKEEWPDHLVKDFLEAMKHVWRAHKLALAFDPIAIQFSMKASVSFDVKFMEALEIPNLVQTDGLPPFIPQAEFPVDPGFLVLDRIIKCQVYLAH